MKQKDVDKYISELAEKIPLMMDAILVHNVAISGEDVFLSGLDDSGITKDDFKKTYYFDMPFYFPVNHKRRMKNAFKKGGWELVKKYLNNLKK